MPNLIIKTQGVKGGNLNEKKVGYTSIYKNSDKLISVDNYFGQAESYKERPEPHICIFSENECIFEGTHNQLIEKLKTK